MLGSVWMSEAGYTAETPCGARWRGGSVRWIGASAGRQCPPLVLAGALGEWRSGVKPGPRDVPDPLPPTKAQNFGNFAATLLSPSATLSPVCPTSEYCYTTYFHLAVTAGTTRRRPSLHFRTLLSAPRPSRRDLSGRIRSKTSCLSSAAASAQLQATRSASSASMSETTRASNMTAWPAAGPPAPWAASGARATGRRKTRYATDRPPIPPLSCPANSLPPCRR